MTNARPALTAALVVWGLGTVGLTLVPAGGAGAAAPTLCVLCAEHATADALLNVVLFVPAGALLVALGVRPPTAVALALATTLSIEAVQTALPGRYPSVLDVVANATGGAVGAALAGRRMPSGGRWAGAAVGLGILAVAAGAWLAEPVAPSPTAELWAQWQPPPIPPLDPYRGRVIAASLDAAPLPADRPLDGRWAAEGREGPGPLVLSLELAPPTETAAAFFAVADDRRHHHLVLAARDRDVLVRRRTRAGAARLREPWWTSAGVLPTARPGDTVRVGFQDRRVTVGAPGVAPATVTVTADLPVSRGWSFLYFSPGIGRHASRVLDALWLMLLFAPAGFLSTRWLDTAIAAALASLAVAAVPVSSPVVDSAQAADLVSAAAGALGGFALRRGADPGFPS